jgi:phosphoenolpyruvate carboxykinase (GTP)
MSGTPAIDWQGKPYQPGSGPAAHPNSRFTVSAKQNAAYTSLADAPEGIPISAILFGGRRRELAPLVYEARDWAHGVLVGAGMASETTAAATGQVGIVRRDSMAMKPFAGYNFGDYWQHWLSFEGRIKQPPKIFHVNWFRQNKDGKFMWPGYGENLRVLKWVIDRCANRVGATESAIGHLPLEKDLDVGSLGIDASALKELLSIDQTAWRQELEEIGKYFGEFGRRIPSRLKEEHNAVSKRLA